MASRLENMKLRCRQAVGSVFFVYSGAGIAGAKLHHERIKPAISVLPAQTANQHERLFFPRSIPALLIRHGW